MKKSIIIASFIFILFILSLGIGYYFLKLDNTEQIEKVESKKIDETNQVVEVIETDAFKEKVTPNTKLVLKKYYSNCNHSINSYVELPKEFVNLDEDELKRNYPEWKVEKFSKEEVILLKEEEAFCNKHYVIREKEGQVAIYKINNNGEEELKELTNIYTNYLPQNDLLNLKNGIIVYGEEELNKTLEDYE